MEFIRASRVVLILALSLLIANASLVAASSDEPWTKYIHSPASRSVSPVGVHSIEGNASVRNCSSGRQVIRLEAGSRISLDFGVEVGGHVSLNARSASSSPLSLAYAESPSFVREISDDTGATPGMDWDQAYSITLDDGHAERAVWYRTPRERFRGGFRFLTLNALADVVLFNVTCEIGFAPNMPDLRSGTGYFYTPDADAEVLNRIWYAGAYTIQTNIAPADTGRWLPQVRPGWSYNATLGVASPALVDGAKRDRAIWPGDLGVQGPVAMMAYGEPGRESVRNSLATLFHYQNASTGMFPFAGPSTGSFRSGARSDTYHSWALISMYDYAVWSGDEAWVAEHWGNITRGVEYITSRLDPDTGLQEQVNENDWARRNTGGFNSALNALNYHALNSLATLAQSDEQKQSWEEAAANIKKGYNDLLWDEEAGLYRDNPTSTLHAQDGNSLALLYGLAENETQRMAVSEGLERNWNDIGPVTPELEDTISPFVSGLELLAHLHGAGNTKRAQRLLRRLWGYLLDDSSGLFTGSTFAEGLAANGSLYYRSERSYKYDAAYTSLAHGWSSGPTTALVTGVLGLRLEEIGGRRWSLRPQLGEGLRSVWAGFETGLGWFEGKVTVGEDGGVEVEVVAPKGTKGRIVFPDDARGRVRVNGREFRGQPEETVLVMDLEM
ncbi:unnamed protein product [Clonostachys byssicola]|uniref:Alpha-L-rhamnosidase six-hairpin glycosidase domain-containing protein n=1 Tax=Clonostachys byssicola TaxID=160290 RepID=A0A9N9UPZ1_9HYPO|nr:unnamed protein product [Clonostachys byssicola]